MRRRIILYAVGGIFALCVIVGIVAPKTKTPSASPTEPAQRAATIALATDASAPSRTARPTSTTAPSRTQRPTLAPSTTPTPAPTKVPPTKAAPTKAPPTAVPAPAASCPGGCTEHKPGCDIKGNVNSKGDKIYHAPGMSAYNNTKVQIDEGDRWFCTRAEAQAAGFREAER